MHRSRAHSRSSNRSDSTLIASGGIRLPGPLWGFTSFGFPGAAMFCLVSGLFIEWGTVRVRKVVTAFRSHPHYSTNLLIGALFFDGTLRLLRTVLPRTVCRSRRPGRRLAIGVMPWLSVTRVPEDADDRGVTASA